jgi:hypothetical protein
MFTVLHVTFVLLYHAAAGLILRRRTCVHKSYAPALRLSSLNASCCFSSCPLSCFVPTLSARPRSRGRARARECFVLARARTRERASYYTLVVFALIQPTHAFAFHTFVVSLRAF